MWSSTLNSGVWPQLGELIHCALGVHVGGEKFLFVIAPFSFVGMALLRALRRRADGPMASGEWQVWWLWFHPLLKDHGFCCHERLGCGRSANEPGHVFFPPGGKEIISGCLL